MSSALRRTQQSGCVALAALFGSLLPTRVVHADSPPGNRPEQVVCEPRTALAHGAIADGFYVAEEPTKKPRGADAGRWFHQVNVTITDGKIETAELPGLYVSGQRRQSVSDGGFYYFAGCIEADGDHYVSVVRLQRSDHGDETHALPKTLRVAPAGRDITLNGKRYRRVAAHTSW